MNDPLPASVLTFALLLPALFFSADTTASQFDGSVESNDDLLFAESISFELDFDPDQLDLIEHSGLIMASAEGFGQKTSVGHPLVPVKELRVLVPPTVVDWDLEIIDLEKDSIYLESEVMGVPQPTHDDMSCDPLPYTAEIGSHLEFSGRGRVRNFDFLSFSYTPVLPSEGRMEVALHMRFRLDFRYEDFGNPEVDFRPTSVFEQNIQDSLLNPEDMNSFASPLHYSSTSVLPDGDYQYVIITNTSYVGNRFGDLADWKNQKGVPAKIVETSFIDDNYAGRDLQERIRNFIRDAVDSWDTEMVLLGGDTAVVPYRSCYGSVNTYSGTVTDSNIPADLYYSDLDGSFNADNDSLWGEVSDDVDLHPDVYVGRAPVQSSSEAKTFVEKILSYERDPPSGYVENATLGGEFLDSYTNSSQGLDNIVNNLLPNTYSTTSLWDRSYGSAETLSRNSFMSSVSDGSGWIFHAGHSNYNVMSMGSQSGGSYNLWTGQVSGYSNDNKLGVLSSVGCIANSFERNDCVGETHVKVSGGGTIAFIGNSRYGWYASLNPGGGPSDRYQYRIAEEIFKNDEYRLGAQFAEGKDNFVFGSSSDGAYRWIQYCLNLIGDPEIDTWTQEPEELNITFPHRIGQSSRNFTVTVRNSTGSPVKGARVCLQQSGYYNYSKTDSNGKVWFNFSTEEHDAINITATAHNHIPFNTSVPLDTEPPGFSLVSIGNATTGEEFEVVYNITDNVGISWSRLHYWQDGVGSRHPSSTDLTRNGTIWNCSIPVAGYSVGNVSFYLECQDIPGNTNISRIVNVTVSDNDPPWLVEDLTGPIGRTGDDFTFSGRAGDNIGVSSLEIDWRYHSETEFRSRSMDHSDGIWSATVQLSSDKCGPIDYRYRISDLSSNMNTTVTSTINVIDDDRPGYLEDLTGLEATTGDPINLLLSARDNIGIDTAWLEWWWEGDRFHENVSLSRSENGTWNHSMILPHNEVKTLNYVFHVNDTHDNWNSTGSFNRSMRDDDEPVLEDDFSYTEAYTGNPVVLMVKTRDNVGVSNVNLSYRLGPDGEWTEEDMDIMPMFNYSATLEVPVNCSGPLHYRFSSYDNNGNVNVSELTTILVLDNIDPSVEWIESASEFRSNGTLMVNASCYDNIGIGEVTLQWWFLGSDEKNNITMRSNGTHFAAIIDIGPTESSYLYYQVHVSDGSGNRVESLKKEVLITPIPEDDPEDGKDDEGDTDPEESDHRDDVENDPDQDGDGLPDEWEVKYGLSTSSNDSGEDPDGDGLTNMEEMLGGSDPTDPDSPTPLEGEEGMNKPLVVALVTAAAVLVFFIIGLLLLIIIKRGQNSEEMVIEEDDEEWEEW